MQYQQKKEEILQGVEFHNLLSFSLVENKLERNFRHIVDALLLNQGKTAAITNQLDHYQDSNDREIKNLKQTLAELANKFQTSQKSRKSIQNFIFQEKRSNDDGADQNKETEENSTKNIQRSSVRDIVDKNQFEKIKSQIQKIKENMSQVDYLENLMKQAAKDINNLKGQLLTINQKSQKSSMKSFKRSSINRDIPDKNQLQKSLNQNSKKAFSNKQNQVHQNNQNNQNNGLCEQLEARFQNEFNNVHIELNTFKLGIEQLKQACAGLKKKQIKHSGDIVNLNELAKKMQKQQNEDYEKLEKMLKNLQLQILNINIQPQQNKSERQKESSKTSQNQNASDNVNYKNQINDKFSKLQAMLQGCTTQAEFNRFKTQTRDKFAKVQKDHGQLKDNLEEQIRKIYDLIDFLKNSDMDALKKDIEQIKEANEQKYTQWERKHNIALSKIEQVKKNLQNLRQDVEFYQTISTQNSPNQNKNQIQIPSQQQKLATVIDNKELQALKKSLTNKIQDQRQYLLGLIRDLQKKLASKGSMEQDIVGIWDRISQINLFMNKKADNDDIKKSIGYLEKKLAAMANHLMKNEQGNEDARVAKTNWFCLSCDKNLHSYSGKVGKHVVWDYMPSKTQGRFMKEQKKSFPSIATTGKRSS